MQGSTVVKFLIAAAIAYLGWKWWSQQQAKAPASPAATTSPAVNCQSAARSAADYWSSNVRAFSNPPYDIASWENFKSEVDGRIAKAGERCSCSDDGCTRGNEAMNELRTVISDMDAAVRSGGPPPSDLVQRAERIDQALGQ
jgi:hypothetical protein